MNMISFEDAIKLIDSGEVVKLQYVSLDLNRKTGGKLRTITGKVTRSKTERAASSSLVISAIKRKNHYANFTRLFSIYMGDRQTAAMKPVHLPLVLMINDKRVLL